MQNEMEWNVPYMRTSPWFRYEWCCAPAFFPPACSPTCPDKPKQKNHNTWLKTSEAISILKKLKKRGGAKQIGDEAAALKKIFFSNWPEKF